MSIQLQIPQRIDQIPDWLYTAQKDNDDERIAQDMLSMSFWKKIEEDADKQAGKANCSRMNAMDGIMKSLADQYVLSRRLAEAANETFDRESGLQISMEQARVRLLSYMRNNGLYRHLEYRDVEDFLVSKFDPHDPGAGINSDITFMIEILIPLLEANNISDKISIGVKDNYSKMRMAIGPLRRVLGLAEVRAKKLLVQIRDEEDPDKKAELEKQFQSALALDAGPRNILEAFMESITGIDPKTQKPYTTRTLGEKLAKIERGIMEEFPISPIQAKNFILPDGKSIFILEVDDKIQENIIKQSLGKLMDLHFGNPYELINMITSLIVPEDTP